MRIDSSAVGMESARSYRASNTTVRRFAITDYQQGLNQGSNALNAAIGGETKDAGNAEEKAAKGSEEKNTATLQDWQSRLQATTSTCPYAAPSARLMRI